jgi:four helix bundle protein
MSRVQKFEDLNVWGCSRDLVRRIYELSKTPSIIIDYGFLNQIQRAAVSVMSNIAEGFERGSNKEFIHFFYIAKGSAGELRSLLYVGFDLNYFNKECFDFLTNLAESIACQIKGYIEYLRKTSLKNR